MNFHPSLNSRGCFLWKNLKRRFSHNFSCKKFFMCECLHWKCSHAKFSEKSYMCNSCICKSNYAKLACSSSLIAQQKILQMTSQKSINFNNSVYDIAPMTIWIYLKMCFKWLILMGIEKIEKVQFRVDNFHTSSIAGLEK